jgi:hypothetical protein
MLVGEHCVRSYESVFRGRSGIANQGGPDLFSGAIVACN